VLSLTPTATDAVRQLVAAAPVDDEDGGIRIAPGDTSEQGTTLTLALVDGPEASDAAVEESGARVFVEPTVAGFLDDKVLDVQVTEGQPSFAIRPQGGSDGQPQA